MEFKFIKKIKGIYELCRFPPALYSVVSWLVVLNIANTSDYIFGSILALIMLFIGHSIVSHALNDIIDYPADLIAWQEDKSKHTGGSKVVFRGLLTLEDLKIIVSIGSIIILLIGLYLWVFEKYTYLVFYGILEFTILFQHGLPPLKTHYRACSEWIANMSYVFIPMLVYYYILTRELFNFELLLSGIAFTSLGVFSLALHHAFDYKEDKKVGKNHIVVYFGIKNLKKILYFHLGLSCILYLICGVLFSLSYLLTFLIMTALFRIVGNIDVSSCESIKFFGSQDFGFVFLIPLVPYLVM